MKVKRLFNRETRETRQGPVTELVECGLEVQRIPANGRQHLSPAFVDLGKQVGWLSIDHNQADGEPPAGGTITIKAENGNFVFRILRGPGRWCCHCGIKLPDDDSSAAAGALAREHVAEHHKGEKSPDPDNPSGYICPRYYDTELVTE